MEEKERYEELNCKYTFGLKDNETSKTYFLDKIIDLLNQQAKYIKTLEEENSYIIFSDGYDENGNKIHRQEFVKYKDKFQELVEENKKLKQSQKQFAIEELRKLKEYIVLNDEYDEEVGCNIIKTFDLLEDISDRIKELKGEE